MSRSSVRLFLSVAAVAIAGPACAETLTGKVTDSSDTVPLSGAIVTVEGTRLRATTDPFGQYRIANVPAGMQTVTVSYVGADTLTLNIDVNAPVTTRNVTLGSDIGYRENILVIGSAAAMAGAINQQRASDAIISVIDSDGLGNLPDTTVPESLARVPGISIETDQGEGRYVTIRGLGADLVAASINGVRTPSPEDRRGVLLDGVPSDLLDSIEVQKSLTPDLDADNIGGVVNLKTISAFTRKGRLLRAKIEGRYNDITGQVSPKATLTWTDTFGDNFGIAASVNYQNLAIEVHNNESGGWGIEDGLFFMNDDYEHRWYDLTRERLGLVANFDWHVDDKTSLYLRTLANFYTDDEVRIKLEFRDLDDGSPVSPTSSRVALNEVDSELRVRREKRQIQASSLGGNTALGAWRFDYEVSWAHAEEDDSNNYDVTFRFEDIQDTFPGDIVFDTRNPRMPRISGESTVLAAIYDPVNYRLDDFEQEFSVNRDTEIAARLDVSFDGLVGAVPVVWKTGLKWRDRNKVRDENFTFHQPDASLDDFATSASVPNWRLANRQPLWPSPALTGSLVSMTNPGTLDAEKSFFDSTAADYDINEQILAGYGMATADFGKLTLIAGLRVEQTDVGLKGFSVVEDETTASPRHFSRRDTAVLPSVNVRYDISGKLTARAAWYVGLARPAFGDMAPSVVFNDDKDKVVVGNPGLQSWEADNFDLGLEFYPSDLAVMSIGLFYKDIDNAIFPATFNRGENPGGGLVPIADFLATLPVRLDDIPADDLAGLEAVSTYINVNKSRVHGLELNYVQSLNFVPAIPDGFLVSANLTMVRSKARLPGGRSVNLLKQADTVANFAVGYESGRWDVRVSANHRGNYLDEVNETGRVGDAVFGRLDRNARTRTIFDASVKYRVNDRLQLYAEGKNLADEPEYYYFGRETRLSQYDEFGRSFILGARLTF